MTSAQKTERVLLLIGNDPDATEELIEVYLDDAKDAIMHRAYPFGTPEDAYEVPEKYHALQCKLALRYYLRRGGEGQNISIENGVHRHYDSVNDEDLLRTITPYAQVI